MTSLTKAIFVNENENIFEALASQGVVYGADIVEHLKFISHKKGNNYIGYYQFLSNEVYYKIYILPKTTPRVENESKNKRNFVALLEEYYRLKAKHDVLSKYLSKNIVDFSFENDKKDNQTDTLDAFIAYQYLDALATVKAFFKKHAKRIYKEETFTSQNIKHRLDLKRNIAELNKSRIHQTRNLPYLYSTLALISSEVLHYFIKHKKCETIQAKKIKSSIDSKYHHKENSSFKINQIVFRKITKLFKSSDEKALYLALLKLLGTENYFEDKSSKEVFKLYHQHSLFFRPEKLFEWMVYDALVEKYGVDCVKKEYAQHYSLAGIKRESKPDFIVEKDAERIIVDAKWKILKNESEISFSDVAKLRRDAIIFGNVTEHILIYPKVIFDKQEYYLEIDNFKFKIEEKAMPC